ncbi:hypothetical protein [Acinetobacter bohemicus]|uniref:hypothetical protein n=1 Tax=Acinetobacter bohemicus TaxID=1435036 RepID=UPI00192C7CB2|nr:hypothetical protein [Acinetobacter bohemicus]CAD9195756.1 Tetratricopeptide repeat protein [Acinetobacter bohemicus]
MNLQEAEDILKQGLQAYENEKYDEAITLFSRIQNKPEYLSGLYSSAQFFLGWLYCIKDKLLESKKAYLNVRYEERIKVVYAKTQYNLYNLLGDIAYLKNIQLEHDLEIYAHAQALLGYTEESLKEKNKYWQNIPKNSELYVKEKYFIQMVEYITLARIEIQNQFYLIFENVRGVLKNLFTRYEDEQYIAHYTNLTVSKLLLSKKGNEDGFNLKSRLRLNTINLMNDPEEGLLLNSLLCLDKHISTQDSAFIACFTLHHDSLNQFRLYAKEGQQEASGLSLVLGKFFLPKNTMLRKFMKK